MTSTDVDLFQPRAIVPAGRQQIAAHHGHEDLDSWVTVASDVIRLAEYICETEFVPKAYRRNSHATAAAILAGRELGLPPMTALRHVQVVEGSPSLSAEYKRARVLAAGHDFDVLEINTTRCRVAGRRRNSGRPPLEITFTIEDAKRAGLVKSRGAWETRPRRMLFARAGTELCDFLFADVTNGLPTTELLAAGDDAEDEFAGYNESPGQAAPSGGQPEPARPAARTAQRRTRAEKPGPTTAAPAAATAPTAAPATSAAAPSDGLPPLPGEEQDPTEGPQPGTGSSPSGSATGDEERDYDSPGTVTTPQLTAIWTVLRQVFGFTNEEKDQARAVAAHIISRAIASTREMSHNEARTILDTLANWQATAKERGEQPRDLLIAYMAASQDQGASGEPEAGGDG